VQQKLCIPDQGQYACLAGGQATQEQATAPGPHVHPDNKKDAHMRQVKVLQQVMQALYLVQPCCMAV